MKKNFFILLLAVVASIGTNCAEIINGTCGDNLTWSLNTQDSTLIIEGSGNMTNHTGMLDYAPWWDYRANIKTVILPSGLTSIGDASFFTCQNLTSIIIPDNVTYIGISAFQDCEHLPSINIPQKVTDIGKQAFLNCLELRSITIPRYVTNIGFCAFTNCWNVESITCEAVTPPVCDRSSSFDARHYTIPLYVPIESVDLYKNANDWENFSNIRGISIEPGICIIASGECGLETNSLKWELSCDGVLSINGLGLMRDNDGEVVMWHGYKDKISKVHISDGVKNIGQSAFYDCKNIISVDMPNSITSIGMFAFYECDKLSSITIPAAVTDISMFAFFGCKALQSVHINDITAWCSIRFSDETSNPLFYAHHLYMNDTEIIDLVIPEGTTSIGIFVFDGCSYLKSITIPSTITIIKGYAFKDCEKLTSISCTALTPPNCNNGAFNVEKNVLLYVPFKSIEAYKNADVWKDFPLITPIPGTEPDGTYKSIIYTDKNSDEIDQQEVKLYLPIVPSFDGFTFLNWQVVAGNLDDGIVIQAIYQANEATATPEVVTNPSNPAQKLIRQGNVYIFQGDKTYTLHGQKVK